jgi:large subunit ribosomal protein L17
MRHRKAINHLGRTKPHRDAMLILKKRITTTLAKAKALRSYIEPLITRSKDDSTHSRRMVFSYLQDKAAVTELFRAVAVKVADRPGGYTRILKTGVRHGDNAEMALIELVDFNELMKGEKAAKKAKTTRSRRGIRKKTGETTAAPKTKAAKTTSGEEQPEAAKTKAAKTTKTAREKKKPQATQEKPAPEAAVTDEPPQEEETGNETSEESTD